VAGRVSIIYCSDFLALVFQVSTELKVKSGLMDNSVWLSDKVSQITYCNFHVDFGGVLFRGRGAGSDLTIGKGNFLLRKMRTILQWRTIITLKDRLWISWLPFCASCSVGPSKLQSHSLLVLLLIRGSKDYYALGEIESFCG
jgi:hypothetical protein